MSDPLRPHGLQQARPPCPSPSPGACSNSCPLSRWWHPTILSSVSPFSSCPLSLSQHLSQGLFQWNLRKIIRIQQRCINYREERVEQRNGGKRAKKKKTKKKDKGIHKGVVGSNLDEEMDRSCFVRFKEVKEQCGVGQSSGGEIQNLSLKWWNHQWPLAYSPSPAIAITTQTLIYKRLGKSSKWAQPSMSPPSFFWQCFYFTVLSNTAFHKVFWGSGRKGGGTWGDKSSAHLSAPLAHVQQDQGLGFFFFFSHSLKWYIWNWKCGHRIGVCLCISHTNLDCGIFPHLLKSPYWILGTAPQSSERFSLLLLLNHVQLIETPWIATCQVSLYFTISRSLLKLMSIKSVMPSNHLIFRCPLLLLPSIFPSIRVFSNESVLHIRCPKYWNFSFSISPSNEYSELISFRMDWFDLLAVQGTLKSLLQHHSSKASILWCSAFFMVQHSRPYITTGKTIALTGQTFVSKVMSLLFNKLSRFVIAFLPRSKHLLISYLILPVTWYLIDISNSMVQAEVLILSSPNCHHQNHAAIKSSSK